MQIIPVSQPAGEEMGGLLTLYERAIPASERRSSEAIRQLTRSRAHRLSVLRHGQEIVGFSILFMGCRVGLLEYLAVDERFRGAGLGAWLYQEARSQAGKLPMIVEVESVGCAGADLEDRQRRAAFYQRLGCRRIKGLNYILPLVAEGAPPPLDLMVDGYEGAAITGGKVRGWLQDIYAGAYGCDANDARLDIMLADHEAGFELT